MKKVMSFVKKFFLPLAKLSAVFLLIGPVPLAAETQKKPTPMLRKYTKVVRAKRSKPALRKTRSSASKVTVRQPRASSPRATAAVRQPRASSPRATVAVRQPRSSSPRATAAVRQPRSSSPRATVAVRQPRSSSPRATVAVRQPTVTARAQRQTQQQVVADKAAAEAALAL